MFDARQGQDHDPRISEAPEQAPDSGLRTTISAWAMWNSSIRAQPRARRIRFALRRMLLGERREPQPAFRDPIEKPREGSIGISCSGGGIRSAAFNLGALQALQRDGELQRADYLAAVSGGSYIAAAFAMVGKAWKGETRPQPGQPGHDDSDPALLAQSPPFAPGSPEEQYLRNRSSYMAPDAAAKVGLGLRLLLGLLFNVLFLALPIVGLTILAGVFVYAPTLDELRSGCDAHCGLTLPTGWLLLPAAVAGAGVALAIANLLVRPRSDGRRRVIQHWSIVLLVLGGAIAIGSIALPVIVGLLRDSGSRLGFEALPVGTTGTLGFASLVAGLAAHLRPGLTSPAGAAKKVGALRKRLNARGRRMLMFVAGAIAGPLVLLAAAVGALAYTFDNYETGTSNGALLLAAGVILAAFGGLYACADLTTWSLHPYYKRRLCTAFALKRVRREDVEPGGTANEHETVAGVAVERHFDELVELSSTAQGNWPTLVVCAAANISDAGATPPGRQVTSFTFSAHSIGGPLTGGLSTKEFEQAFGRRRKRDLTLPAAVAMSGAAVSPSMGKMTRPSLRFLLALANLRLGVWVPNPRWVAGARLQHGRLRIGPPRPLHLLLELLGRNRIDAKYLYVTDGGHYENLGLVELLRRGCTQIYCFDASGGQSFAELGDAVALARSELGVVIEIDPLPLAPQGDPPTAQSNVVSGSFRYRSGECGTLVYARNVVSRSAPWDVHAHQREDPRFPDDSTVDQLYTDQKFESYRALGELAGDCALDLMKQEARGQMRGTHHEHADRVFTSAGQPANTGSSAPSFTSVSASSAAASESRTTPTPA